MLNEDCRVRWDNYLATNAGRFLEYQAGRSCEPFISYNDSQELHKADGIEGFDYWWVK